MVIWKWLRPWPARFPCIGNSAIPICQILYFGDWVGQAKPRWVNDWS